jgi:hypothetical protein
VGTDELIQKLRDLRGLLVDEQRSHWDARVRATLVVDSMLSVERLYADEDPYEVRDDMLSTCQKLRDIGAVDSPSPAAPAGEARR